MPSNAFLFVLALSLFQTTPLEVVADDALYTEEGASQRQGDADTDAVSEPGSKTKPSLRVDRGLDNAGKTTIVKKIMDEDVNSVSPTLGFIIKTIDYDG